MVRKYLNYLIFAAVVLVVVGLAVNYSLHTRSLIDAMSSSDPKAKEAAALELVKGERFMDTITSEQPETRLKATESVELVANDAAIVKGTEKDAPDFRANATAQVLSLTKDTDKIVRDRAVLALENLGKSPSLNADVQKAILVGLKDGDNYVRKGTIAALVTPQTGIGPRFEAGTGIDIVKGIVDLMKAEGGARGPGGDVLSNPTFNQGEARAKSASLLIAQSADTDGAVRQGACDALGKLGDLSAVEPLKKLMHTDSDPQVRRVAIGALALIADKSCEDALVEAISNSDSDSEARAQSATGLGKIASQRAVATLVKALDDDDLKLRSTAVTALARAGRPADNGAVNSPVIAALVGALQGANNDSRAGAAKTLQTIATPEANTALIAVLKNSSFDSESRSAAATALGFEHNKVAVEPLIQALSDPDGDLNSAARNSLTKIGIEATERLSSLIQTDGTTAFYATQALAGQGVTALPILQKLAAGTNIVAQHWAAVALGGLGAAGVQEARPTLQLLAKSADPDVQYVASEQLRRLGN